MQRMIESLSRVMAIVVMTGLFLSPVMVQEAMAQADPLTCALAGANYCPLGQECFDTVGNNPTCEAFFVCPSGTVASASSCPSGQTCTFTRGAYYYCTGLPAACTSNNDCLSPLVCNLTTGICVSSGGGGGGGGTTPEMSDYLAMAFIVVAGGMIYIFRRRARGKM